MANLGARLSLHRPAEPGVIPLGGGVTADEMREMQHTAFLGPRSDKSARVDLALLMQKYAR